MAWSNQKTDAGNDIVWSGAELGIAPSPLKGTANIQNANISTETGEIMASFGRFRESQVPITNGTLTASVSDGAVLLDAPATLLAGQWITISASTIPSALVSTDYLVVAGGGGGGGDRVSGSGGSEASGGGGAGGVRASSFTPSVGAYNVVVGAGGTGGTNTVAGTSGGMSYITQTGNISIEVLCVGGGGGGAGNASGGTDRSGGGGGGGNVVEDTVALATGVYAVTIGSGGAGGTGSNGSDGGTTSFSSVTAIGGGGGGTWSNVGSNGSSGGGGGGSNDAGGTGSSGGNGGAGGATNNSAGGGGGDGGNGANAPDGTGGAGGNGTASTLSGASVLYGGGGGGGGVIGGGAGTDGGGTGNGGTGAAANRGGGGGGNGGAADAARAGATGAAGVVIIRFTTAGVTFHQSGGSVAVDGSETVITFTSNGIFTISKVDIVAGGGGGGGSQTVGLNGGSGGGGGSTVDLAGGTGISGEGSAGGAGVETAGSDEAGGGGGGASAAGENGGTDGAGQGGDGGNGVSSSISGAAVTYGGGGAGGGSENTGTGGTGGGGGSGQTNGTDGLGGGGGGNFNSANAGGTGGRGIVILSYPTGSMTATGGVITFAGGNTIHTFFVDGTFTVQSIAAAGTYFVSYKNSANKIKLSAIFDPYGLYPIAHGTTGTATFSTLATPAAGVAKAVEPYNSDDEDWYRYYILDSDSRTWVYDTQVYATTLAANGVGEAWMLPDPTDYSAVDFTGLTILNGWVVQPNNNNLYGKPTVDLGREFDLLEQDGQELQLMNPFPTHMNPAYTGHQGKMYYGDGNYVGALDPDTALGGTPADVQSYCAMTGSGTVGTITELIAGASPVLVTAANAYQRIPIVFFATQTTGVPIGITEGVVYWAQMNTVTPRQFEVYEAQTGGSALTITTIGTSYFNTFYPIGEQHNTADVLVRLFLFSPQALVLPVFERVQCMVEIDNILLVGGRTNTAYPWNQVNALPNGLIALPEGDMRAMVNVNNMAYIFAGNKGNVYLTNGSTASLAIKVPDYCAGVPGTPLTYIEPRFTWGDAAYLRGRVYFSILDQTSTKLGNCGGVWSFIPPQNFYFGQDTGLSLRLENQNSYGSYNGMATIILPNEEQNAIAPQYWASWQNSYSIATSTSFGIDQTDDVPVTMYVVETDLLPVGSFLDRETYANIEYKLTTPLASGDSVALYWRVNSTSAWTALTAQSIETADPLSGYFNPNFEKSQWLQLRAEVTTNGTTTSSFGRMSELRAR